MQTQAYTVSCFGKMPTHGDFVRYNADGDVVRALDGWIQQGMYALKTRGDGSLQEAYDRLGSTRFFFRPRNSEAAVAGVIQSSQDRVGRRFPLVIACELDDVHARSPLQAALPATLNPFLEGAAEIARQAASGTIAYADLDSNLERLPPPDAGAGGTDGYEAYVDETRWGDFAERTWGYFDDVRKYHLFRNLLDLREGVAARGSAPAGIALRFPMSDGGWSGGLEPSFWIDLMGRLLEPAIPLSAAFWRAGGGDAAPHLTVFPAPPAAHAFLDVVVGVGRGVVDLEESTRTDAVGAVLSIPPSVGQPLEDEKLTLRALLAKLPG